MYVNMETSYNLSQAELEVHAFTSSCVFALYWNNPTTSEASCVQFSCYTKVGYFDIMFRQILLFENFNGH